MVRQQAQAEKLTLLVAESTAGYFGVCLTKPGQPKPYQARVWRGGKDVYLGCFATAEEAALCVARTPEGQAAAAERAAAAPALTSEEARQQAQAEKLTLLVADNTTGYLGVHLNRPGLSKPYLARVTRGGKIMYLGSFATAEEAALCVARTPEGRAAAAERARAAAAPPLTSEEARQQAQAEKLTLLVAKNTTGYFGVHLDSSRPGLPKPYLARVTGGGKRMHLGCFATAEEAALCVARSPEGRAAAAARAPSAGSQGAPPAVSSGASLKEEGTVPPMPPGTFVKEERVVPLMPPDAFVKVEVVVKEEEGSGGRPKWQRTL
jgi:predicted secreted protein